MRWPDRCEAQRWHTGDEDDFFGRQLAFNMLPLLPDREGGVRGNVGISSIGVRKFAGRWRDDLRQCRAVAR